ncbi:sporangiospore maturation cell wall hydrolase GsmA [Pilimelia columellifera]|uniref:Mannosyl-glycoprotein endo-beta-N-acetylglucosamidase-like domain-containing protein n=1 Tax=Pilimelia columellifera subsp. columellifera TaxID=706583 RepID=A0ABN3N9B4_9ACTN
MRLLTMLSVAAVAATIVAADLVAVRDAAQAAPRRSATIAAAGASLSLRAGPTTGHRVVGQVAHGVRVGVLCQVYGQGIAGPVRRSGFWNRLSTGGYLSDGFVQWRPNRVVAWCGGDGRRALGHATTTIMMRRGPGLASAPAGRLLRGTSVGVRCQRWGQRIRGPYGATNSWYLLTNGRYAPAALIRWSPSVPVLPWCGQAPWTAPPGTAAFVLRVAGGARASYRAYRVPASVTIAQAILESGWGRSLLTRRDHNYFGMKCFGAPGGIAVGCRSYATTECGKGRCWRTRASFRAYPSLTGSMVDHGRALRQRPRYRGAFRYTRSPNQFAVAIHRAGYATGPTYSSNLIRIMRSYNLYRFDR